MKRIYDWVTNYWWILLICLIVAYIIFVSVVDLCELNKITNTMFNYFNQIIGPLVVVLGLILGYPLLKRKLIDSYVTKQFEIIHENNRIIRKECLLLLEKYPIEYISQNLNSEYLTTILNDIKRLNELAIDANPDAYRYSYLLYKSLQIFNEKTQIEIPNNYHESYYCETLSTFVNNHIEQIFRYSKSIGFIPRNSNIMEKPILTSKLKKYVIDNKYYHVEGDNYSLSFKKASALLVAFFSTNIGFLSSKNGLLFQSCYETVESPSPFARIMYNQSIYMPLILEGEKIMNITVPRLVLVGYVRQKSTKIESGITNHYLVCHYANISNCGFVKGCLKNKKTFVSYKDIYIEKTVLNETDIEEFHINGESVILKIEEQKTKSYFNNVKKLLCKKMSSET